MELVTPGIGLIFWMTISFGLVLFILGKFAWKPIMKGLHEREDSIEKALHAADEAKKEMQKLKAGNEQLLLQAKEERDNLMKEARQLKEAIISEARARADEEGNRIIAIARESIQYEKMAALNDLKSQIAIISIEIAEKIMKQELADKEKQTKLTETLLKDIKIN